MLFHLQTGINPGEPIVTDSARDDAEEEFAQAGGDWPTLLELLGGAPTIDCIVERLADRLRRDPLLSSALAGVDVAVLKRHQSRFCTEAFGAVRADRPLMPLTVRVSGEQFTRVLLHIHDTLTSLALSPALTEQLMLAVLARGFVLDGPTRLIS